VNLTVILEHRFDSTPDGRVWTWGVFSYPFWSRYLEVFGRVRVVARVREVSVADIGWERADGDRVTFIPLPYYIGPFEYAKKARKLRHAMRDAITSDEAFILRVPGMIGSLAFKYLRKARYPVGLEVVGDPHDVFAPGAAKHPLRPFFRWWFSRQLRHQCEEACAVAYVTEGVLQRRYPAASAFTTHYSSVRLTDEAFALSPRPKHSGANTLKIVTVGTLAQLYKAPDILIDATAKCIDDGLNIELVLIGDGKHRAELEARVNAAGIGDHVAFLGQLPAGEAVREQLDRADLFVLPSRQEGLPRAMIEAMARALPCIGSTVGGIPELLPAEDMVPPNDPVALAQKIRDVVSDSERMALMSARNLENSRKYHEKVLRERRVAFYRHVRERTETWLGTKR
jgi:glycosyltransferase involved in cell wall biosynthesis